MHSGAPVAAIPRRDRILIFTSILLVTALAWAYLIYLDRQMSSGVEYDRMMAEMGMPTDRPWTAADLFFTFAMWTVMMAAMMAGAVTPVLLVFAAAQAARKENRAGRVPLVTLLFGAGYLIVWIGFSAGAAVAQWGLHETAMLSPAMAAANPRVAGAILVAAGAYQLTRWKGTCLSHCQSPLGFLMSNWRDGPIGALRMGLGHGAHCLGCCWAMMCVLFAVGVMNLVWVAALTLVVLLEKAGPAGGVVARTAGVVMIGAGILAAIR